MSESWLKAGIEYIIKDSTRGGAVGIQKSLSEIDKAARGVTKTLGAIKAVGVAGLGYLGVRDLVRTYQETAKAITDTAKAADVLQISTESLSGLQYVADQMGVAGDAMTTFLERLARFSSEAVNGSQEAQIALQQLGVTAEELGRLAPDEALLRLADAFQAIPNASDRVRLAFQIFGRGGAELVNVLALGSEGIRELEERAAKLGGTLSRVGANQVRDAARALKDIGTAASEIKTQAVIALAPYITAIAGSLADAATQGEGIGPKIAGAFEQATLAAAGLLDTLDKIVAAAHKLPQALGGAVYTRTFNNAMLQDVADRYEIEMGRRNRAPYRILPGGPMGGAQKQIADEALYEQMRREVEAIYLPHFDASAAGVAVETPGETAVERSKRLFAEIEARAQQARSKAYQDAYNQQYLTLPNPVPGMAGIPLSRSALPRGTTVTAADIRSMEEQAKRTEDLRSQVDRLDASLADEIDMVRRSGATHSEAAQVIRYESIVYQAYGNDLDTAKRKVEDFRRKLEELKTVRFIDSSLRNLGETLADIAIDFQNASHYAEQFLRTLARNITNEYITQPLMDAIRPGVMSLFNPRPAGPMLGSPGVTGVHVPHTGGRIGYDDIPTGIAPASWFTHAPRLHAGLRSDEFPAILQRGEQVIPKGGPRLGGPPKVEVRVSNPPGTPLEAETAGIEFDGEKMVLGIVLKNIRQGGVLRDQIRLTSRGG